MDRQAEPGAQVVDRGGEPLVAVGEDPLGRVAELGQGPVGGVVAPQQAHPVDRDVEHRHLGVDVRPLGELGVGEHPLAQRLSGGDRLGMHGEPGVQAVGVGGGPHAAALQRQQLHGVASGAGLLDALRVRPQRLDRVALAQPVADDLEQLRRSGGPAELDRVVGAAPGQRDGPFGLPEAEAQPGAHAGDLGARVEHGVGAPSHIGVVGDLQVGQGVLGHFDRLDVPALLEQERAQEAPRMGARLRIAHTLGAGESALVAALGREPVAQELVDAAAVAQGLRQLVEGAGALQTPHGVVHDGGRLLGAVLPPQRLGAVVGEAALELRELPRLQQRGGALAQRRRDVGVARAAHEHEADPAAAELRSGLGRDAERVELVETGPARRRVLGIEHGGADDVEDLLDVAAGPHLLGERGGTLLVVGDGARDRMLERRRAHGVAGLLQQPDGDLGRLEALGLVHRPGEVERVHHEARDAPEQLRVAARLGPGDRLVAERAPARLERRGGVGAAPPQDAVEQPLEVLRPRGGDLVRTHRARMRRQAVERLGTARIGRRARGQRHRRQRAGIDEVLAHHAAHGVVPVAGVVGGGGLEGAGDQVVVEALVDDELAAVVDAQRLPRHPFGQAGADEPGGSGPQEHPGPRVVELAHLLPAVGHQLQATGQGPGARAQQDVPVHDAGLPDVVARLAPGAQVVPGGVVHPAELGGAQGGQAQRVTGLLLARGPALQHGGEEFEGALVPAPVVPVLGPGPGRAGRAVAHLAAGQGGPGVELGLGGGFAAGGRDELVAALGDRFRADPGRRVAPLHVGQQRLDLGEGDLRVVGGVVDDPLVAPQDGVAVLVGEGR